MRSIDRISAEAAATTPACARIASERNAVVDRVLSITETDGVRERDAELGISLTQIREHLFASTSLAREALNRFRTPGYWASSGRAFSLFLWGLADLIDRPIIVIERDLVQGTVLEPVWVYRARQDLFGPSARLRRDNYGLCAQMTFDEVLAMLAAWQRKVVDGAGAAASRAQEQDPPFALVEFGAVHYSPFVFSL